MLKKTANHLLFLNAVVLVSLLGIFSLAVYFSVSSTIDQEARQKLQSIADALISSIEPPDQDEAQNMIPDIVQDNGDTQHPLAGDLALQWYDSKKVLLAQKGLLRQTLPFKADAGFELQRKPRALLLTRIVHRQGAVIGYLRVGMLLADFDRYKNILCIGLLLGLLVTLLIGVLAVLYLVRQALKPVANLIERLTDFTGDAAHELKNPIMAIKTNAAVALKYPEGMRPGDREKIAAIANAAEQMNNTVENLLVLAEADQSLPASGPLNVSQAIANVVDDLSVLASSKNISVTTSIDDGASVNMAPADFKIIIGNILKNAIIYSPKNSQVSIEGLPVGTRLQLRVVDNGVGISEAELPKVFDRFWRSDKARTYSDGGNGLGLAIVKTVVDRYRGEITIKSVLASGTTVTVTI